jgi:hypothetical protein
MTFSQVLSMVLTRLRKFEQPFLLYVPKEADRRDISPSFLSSYKGAKLSSEGTCLPKSVLLFDRVTKKATKF